MTSCDIVLPCRDEAAALPALIALVPEGYGVVVVDNGSSDGTAEVAASLGARVVTEPTPGYGAAVHAGVEAAGADLVAVLDGDGSMDPRELPAFVALVEAGEADMVCGRRRPVRAGLWPWHARAGNAAVLWWLRRRTGLSLHDIAPVRVCRREPLLALGVEDRRFGYPVELLAKAQAAGWRLVERDISYRPRAEGTRSKVSGSVRGTVRAARDFARVLPR
ncbi:glycosyl transferase [Marmoricola endophyticus]|uniref:Glycosyl transferase n=1 Tax=Marmoricola endophyticus TaxID=2040280 RepID=A0A917B872_9ACTN|nr:glycosyltransferase family 2 protein [Marmoricola endophyticus]GGF30704.1 glycosyl transferase [Marmoricola endophyticus]